LRITSVRRAPRLRDGASQRMLHPHNLGGVGVDAG
jgi:hypothetical protein